MNGQAKNLLTLINTEPNKVNIDWNIYSPFLNLNAFTFLLKHRQSATTRKKTKKGYGQLASKIDRVLDEGRLHVILNTDKLVYKDFVATKVIADVILMQDDYIINNVSMSHADGRMQLKGTLSSERDYHKGSLNVKMDNVNVKKVFAAFDDFGQDGITAQNLEGSLSSNILASMKIDQAGKIVPNSLASKVDFSLKQGELNNYEPIKKLQKFVFKNRNFDNIRFAELKDHLDISNGEITISRMEIESSVISFFVEGVYNKKGSTDLSIHVPFNNLKKRGEDYNPENISADKKEGRGINIRARPGSDGKVQFKLDLFNKYNKEKKKDLK